MNNHRYAGTAGSALALISMAGCANLDTYNVQRTLKPDSGQAVAVFIDAKQRAILYGQRPNGNGTSSNVVCAEPSPDALSALAASSNLGLSVADKANLTLAAALSEQASSLGSRTESIQLERDPSYRFCEGYLDGALSGLAVEDLQRRQQTELLALVAIERLTGAAAPPATVVGNLALQSATPAAGQNPSAPTGNPKGNGTPTTSTPTPTPTPTPTATSVFRTIGPGDLTLAVNRPGNGPSVAVFQTAAVNPPVAAQHHAAGNTHPKAKATHPASTTPPTKTAADGNTTLGNTTQNSPTSADAATMAVVAPAVEDIVNSVLERGYSRDICATLIEAGVDGRAKIDDPSVAVCRTYLQETVRSVAAQIRYLESQIDLRDKVANLIIDQGNKPIPQAQLNALMALAGYDATDGGGNVTQRGNSSRSEMFSSTSQTVPNPTETMSVLLRALEEVQAVK